MKDFYEYYISKVRIDSFTGDRWGEYTFEDCGYEFLLSQESGNGAHYYWIVKMDKSGHEIGRWNTLGVLNIVWNEDDVLKMDSGYDEVSFQV